MTTNMNDKATVIDSSRSTLEGTPAKALKFLSAAGTNPAIRGVLVTVGYTPAEHEKGWQLMRLASGGRGTPDAIDGSPAAAMHELDGWDEDGMRITRAAFTRYPEQYNFVFSDGLAASTGMAAVFGVEKLLDRLDALEKSPERKATRDADHAALATLSSRGIDRGERARLRKLVATAQSLPEDGAGDAILNAAEAAQERDASLMRLREWYEDWTQMARTVIKPRAHLISLGLAHRRTTEEASGSEAGGTPDAPVDPATAQSGAAPAGAPGAKKG